ncbi:hypothetical protein BH11MYX1_BH11MYX1_41840 [soil metagenome]
MKPLAAALLFGLAAGAHAAPVVTTVADAEAAKALDSVLERVVIAKPALDASKGSGAAKGSLEITKDGGKPTIKGALTAGTEGKAGYQQRTIDWNFTTNVGAFSSTKRDTSETMSVVVTGTAMAVHQVSATKGGAVERESTIDSKTVKLKAGGTAAIVTTDDKVTIAAAAAVVQFQGTGQPTLLAKGGYVKSDLPNGGQVYTHHVIQVGTQTLSEAELAGFMKNRVAN